MERDELAAWLRLTLTPGVGNAIARKLLATFGLPASIFQQSGDALRQVVAPQQAEALAQPAQDLAALLETTWQWLQTPAIDGVQRRVVVLGDADYPTSLLAIEDPPLMLYLMGSSGLNGEFSRDIPNSPKSSLSPTNFNWHNTIAIVGSRNPTPQGAVNARQFAQTLVQAGLCVVSGLALGVDGAAHEGALDALTFGKHRPVTVAVVGTGLDRVYPKGHRDLAHRIARNGLIVSEYPLGTPPLAANFPKRNRLIAGLAQGTLVIEAALKSGSLITARLTAEQGKDVFAIPGSIHSPQARGCHSLIKQGAKLVESAQDVLEEMKMETNSQTSPDWVTDESLPAGADDGIEAHTALLDALGFDPVSLDVLQARSGLDTANLQAQLMTLELDSRVERLPGGLFQRMHRG